MKYMRQQTKLLGLLLQRRKSLRNNNKSHKIKEQIFQKHKKILIMIYQQMNRI